VRKRILDFQRSNGFFGSGDTEILALTYDAYNVDQKSTRLSGAHTMKFGFRWAREIGFKSNPQTNRFTFITSTTCWQQGERLPARDGQPAASAWVDQFGGFIQDDWRVTDRFVLNLGLRYDYYPGIWLQVHRCATIRRRSTT
jgi:outer membrane receptor protein involved in Fe transport